VPVDAGVADVRDRHDVFDTDDGAHGGAHAGEFGVVEDGFRDEGVGGEQRGLQRVLGVFGGVVGAVGFGDPLDGDRAGDVTSGVSAHPVGDHEEVFAGVGGVLVVGAEFAHVGDGGAFSGAGHPLPPQLETGGADAYGCAERHGCGDADAFAVEERAVGGVE